MSDASVSIRGTRDGIAVEIREGELLAVLEEIDRKLGKSAEFFRGGRVSARVGRRTLCEEELETLGMTLYRWGVTLWAVESESEATCQAARRLGLETRLCQSTTPASDPIQSIADIPPAPSIPVSQSEPAGLVVRRTIRSGMSLVHPGPIVIIGDVNAGAEVIAGGDIIVWGKLRGLAHAGSNGRTECMICALRMLPAQLRIADQVAHSPQASLSVADLPQVALIRSGEIVVESWSESLGASGRRPALGRLSNTLQRLLGRGRSGGAI